MLDLLYSKFNEAELKILSPCIAAICEDQLLTQMHLRNLLYLKNNAQRRINMIAKKLGHHVCTGMTFNQFVTAMCVGMEKNNNPAKRRLKLVLDLQKYTTQYMKARSEKCERLEQEVQKLRFHATAIPKNRFRDMISLMGMTLDETKKDLIREMFQRLRNWNYGDFTPCIDLKGGGMIDAFLVEDVERVEEFVEKSIGKKWCPVHYKNQKSSDLDKNDLLSPVKENEKETGSLHSEERAEVPHFGER